MVLATLTRRLQAIEGALNVPDIPITEEEEEELEAALFAGMLKPAGHIAPGSMDGFDIADACSSAALQPQPRPQAQNDAPMSCGLTHLLVQAHASCGLQEVPPGVSA